MDFELSKAQKDIQKAARDFAKGEFDKELAAELEEKHEFPIKVWQKAGELGFIGLHYPEVYGGQDYGCLENALVVEEFCRRDSSIGSALMSCDFASENVLRYGTDEQKKEYLPPVAYGEAISGGAFTEPDHGSDITSMNTTAVRDGDDWVLNGVKTFITNAGVAHFYVVLCQTDVEAGHRGQSMILVPADAEGLEIADVGLKMGIRLSPTGELSFKNVRVPAKNLLGKEGRGFYQVLEFFDETRPQGVPSPDARGATPFRIGLGRLGPHAVAARGLILELIEQEDFSQKPEAARALWLVTGQSQDFAGLTAYNERRAAQAVELLVSDAQAPVEVLTDMASHSSHCSSPVARHSSKNVRPVPAGPWHQLR